MNTVEEVIAHAPIAIGVQSFTRILCLRDAVFDLIKLNGDTVVFIAVTFLPQTCLSADREHLIKGLTTFKKLSTLPGKGRQKKIPCLPGDFSFIFLIIIIE